MTTLLDLIEAELAERGAPPSRMPPAGRLRRLGLEVHTPVEAAVAGQEVTVVTTLDRTAIVRSGGQEPAVVLLEAVEVPGPVAWRGRRATAQELASERGRANSMGRAR